MKKCGQAVVAVLMVCLIIGILATAMFSFQSGQIHLLSKSAADYLSLSVAETGLHCILAEMKADYQFVTHGNPYVITKDDKLTSWPSSTASHKYAHVKNEGGLKISDHQKGTYKGTIKYEKMAATGEFKTRVKLIGSKNNPATKTVDEAHRYFLIESYGRVNNSCRKISVIIERITPANFLMYDGEILDVGGYGPYRGSPGELASGRLYGHEQIVFSSKGTGDRVVELKSMEKISTPGYINTKHIYGVDFLNKKKGQLRKGNDSQKPETFETFGVKDGKVDVECFVLDGYHGAKPQKLPMLNPDYYKNATKPSPTILNAGSHFEGFKESWWRNPYKPNEVVYDLFFGWDYKKTGDKYMIYSEVPIRIWGCPKWKALTIFCEKDVYIAGDFNANPDNPQNYKINDSYKNYEKEPRNGYDKNGVMVLSMGRIWFDYSNPLNFLRNEMTTALDYEICKTLGNDNLSDSILHATCYPKRNSTSSGYGRKPATALSFTKINSLYNLPKTDEKVIAVVTASLPMQPALSKLRQYLGRGEDKKKQNASGTTNLAPPANENISRDVAVSEEDDGDKQKEHFYIKAPGVRLGIYEAFGLESYTLGVVTPKVRETSIKSILKAADNDIEKEKPDASFGTWELPTRMFYYALRKKCGFRMPEMTVNALLVDSAELNNKWSYDNKNEKALNELGNIENEQMRCFPWMGKNERFILRHLGSMIHLRNRPEKTTVNGMFANDVHVLRRNIYDNSYVSASGDYFPPYPMSGFTIISWKDEICTLEEFKKVN